MTHKLIDRAKEVASSGGTGNFTLTGAVSGFQTFGTKLTTNGDTSLYTAVQGTDWESGKLTRVSSGVYSRTVYDNSAGTTSAINFASAPTVYSTAPAARLPVYGSLFSAYPDNSGQSIPANTWTKVVFTQEEFDYEGDYDAANSKFVCVDPGVYFFAATACIMTNTHYLNASLYVNGSQVKSGNGSASLQASLIAVPVLLAANDYVEVYVYCTSSEQIHTSGRTTSNFTGHLLRRV